MRIDHIFRIGNIVLGGVNLALFGLWIALVRKDSVQVGSDASTYILNQVSMQVTALSAMIALGALLLAGLGLFGFQVAMERAENRADTAARSAVAAKWDEFVKQYNPTIRTNPGPQGPTPATEDAQEAKGGL